MSLFGDGLLGKGSMLNPGGFLGKAGDLKAFAGSKAGSVFSGRALLQGGPKEQDMESARTFDVFGSPATAGTNMQTPARAGALAYGAAAGLGAMGVGSAFSGGGSLFSGGATGMNAAPSATTGGPGAVGGTAAGSNFMNYARLGNAVRSMGGQQQGGPSQSMQHQYVGQPSRNPYMQGFPWG